MHGAGQPVVLLHGFGEDGRIWDNWILHLSKSYRVLVPDIPGSGRSTLLNKKGAGLVHYADAMMAILEKESINSFVLAGHSMGGYIALGLAERYPARLKALALIHSTAYADDEEKIETRRRLIDFIRRNGSEEFLKTSIPGLFYDDRLSQEFIMTLVENGRQILPDALTQYQQAMIERPDRSHWLAHSSLPVFFQIGRHDKAVPFDKSLSQCHLPAISDIQILRHSAHMGMLEEPERSLKGFTLFLNRFT